MINTLSNIICPVAEFVKYKLCSGYWKGNRIHSPAAFEFVNKVLSDKTNYNEYKLVKGVREKLSRDKSTIVIKELGGGSRKFHKADRKIKSLIQNSSVSVKYGKLLYRAVKYYKPDIVIEIGTSLGISALYMALANEGTLIHTIEGNKALMDTAKNNILAAGCNNVRFHHGLFDDVLPELLSTTKVPALVFVDGNHTYKATMTYYKLIKEKMKEGLIIFDDIYWSSEMKMAWKEIVDSSDISIDLYRVGIILTGNMLTPCNYRVRF